jgi:hypothetical protein
VSAVGLKISTRNWAILARFSRRMSSSVLPENMEPQMTSIHPRDGLDWAEREWVGSKNKGVKSP